MWAFCNLTSDMQFTAGLKLHDYSLTIYSKSLSRVHILTKAGMGGGLGRVAAGEFRLSEICSTGPTASADSSTVKSSLRLEGTPRVLRLAL